MGNSNIIDHHLRDLKYTQFRFYKVIRDSKTKRGVNLRREYSQINKKNFFINKESSIYSKKFFKKTSGFGEIFQQKYFK